MILKKVKIYNYRQLQKVELDLQNSLTVLAGPNNSGKTTLISVLKGMFRDKKLSFTYSDIPTNLSTSWVEKIIPVFQSIKLLGMTEFASLRDNYIAFIQVGGALAVQGLERTLLLSLMKPKSTNLRMNSRRN